MVFRWLLSAVLWCTFSCVVSYAQEEPLLLTAEEITWIEANPVVTVGADVANMPFDFIIDDSLHGGISSSYLESIGRRTGLTFKIETRREWTSFLGAVRDREIDVIASIVPTDERRAFMLFSEPYASFPTVIFSRQDAPFISGMRSLIGRKVAVEEGFFTHDLIRRDFPEIELLLFRDRKSAMEAVATRTADAYVGNLAAGSFIIRSQNLANMQVAAPTTFGRSNLAFGVRSDWPELVSILNKAMMGISPVERNQVEQEWVAVRYQYSWSWALFTKWLIGFSVVLAVIMLWNIFQRREISRRKKVERQLAIAKNQAEQANLKKGEFLGMAAHDLKNPLAGISVCTEMLIDQLRESKGLKDDAQTRETLFLIRESADSMLELITDLLDLENIDSEAKDFAKKEENVVQLVHEVLMLSHASAEKKQIVLEADTPEEMTAVVSRQRIMQCFDNLVSNAVKFSPAGSAVRVSLKQVVGSTGREVIRFSVKDNGPGLRPEDHQQLFQRFSKLSARPTGGESSSGLGLSIVKSLVEKHGGRIWCESEYGKGAEFIIELPMR